MKKVMIAICFLFMVGTVNAQANKKENKIPAKQVPLAITADVNANKKGDQVALGGNAAVNGTTMNAVDPSIPASPAISVSPDIPEKIKTPVQKENKSKKANR